MLRFFDTLEAKYFVTSTIGYPGRTGELLERNEMEALVNGLEGNGMLQEYTHVLAGERNSVFELPSHS